MKRMLINATNPEELRVAVVEGQKLLNLDIENAAYQQKQGNIYKGRVTRVETSLQAAFVEYGGGRQGFLPIKEIGWEYYPENEQGKTPSPRKVRIQDVLAEGQELIVQIDKEERGSKGAALTTLPSLAGRYLVLMPNNPRAGGVSRRIEGEERKELRETLNSLELPEGMGLIIRTAGIGKGPDQLQPDLNHLLHLWHSILEQAKSRSAPFLIYQEGNTIIQALRDNFEEEINEILVDDPGVADTARQFMQAIMPECANRVKSYKDSIPLFSRFQIEHQIDTAYSREVALEGGGSLVLDPTEALVAIDINSAKATKGQDLEETALQTNLEAAEEIPRQLRLRDVGGLVVIDFIDMKRKRNIQAVEDKLRESVKADRARIKVGKISRFGLMEMTRQRLRPSLGEATHTACPRCNGQGRLRTIESSALHLLRILEEESLKEQTTYIDARVPVEMASYLLNEKRSGLSLLEERYGVKLTVIPDPNLLTPSYAVERGRARDLEVRKAPALSYKQIPEPEPATNPRSGEMEPIGNAVSPLSPTGAALRPQHPEPESDPSSSPASKELPPYSFLKRMLGAPFWEQSPPHFPSDGESQGGTLPSESIEKGNGSSQDPKEGTRGASGGGSSRRGRRSSRGRGSRSQGAGINASKPASGSRQIPGDNGQANAQSVAKPRATEQPPPQGEESSSPPHETVERKTEEGEQIGSHGERARGQQGRSRPRGRRGSRGGRRRGGRRHSASSEGRTAQTEPKSTEGAEGSKARAQGPEVNQADKDQPEKQKTAGSTQTTTRGKRSQSNPDKKRVSPPKPTTEEIQVPAHTAEIFEVGETQASGGNATLSSPRQQAEQEPTSES